MKLTQIQEGTSSESPQSPYQGTAARERHRTWTCPAQAKNNATKGYKQAHAAMWSVFCVHVVMSQNCSSVMYNTY